ncbi:hypothetical protein O3M35_000392 [Rhynocoris fuscipes]|uniref:MBD domain-containing protein n=1 Tax=Rhynocoris fuscipes TaxID=488301 RepID=A0AAW1DSN3_9HEMI
MSRNSFVEHYGIGRVEIVEVDEEDSDEYDEDDLGIAMRRDEHINMESIQRIINGVVPPRHEDEEEEEEDEEREIINKETENEKDETENYVVKSDERSITTGKGGKGLEIVVFEGRNLEISEKPLEIIEVSDRIVEEKQSDDTSDEGELIIDDNLHSSQVDSEDEEFNESSLKATETYQNVEIEEISEHESDAERMCDDDFRQSCTIGEAVCNLLEMDVETENNPNNEVSNKETSFSLLHRNDDKITSECIKDVEMNDEETIGCLDVNLEKDLSHVDIELSPNEERIACMSTASASENNEMETEKSLDCESPAEKIIDNEDLPLSSDMIVEDIPSSENLKINASTVEINNLCQEKDIICDEDMKDSQVELDEVIDMKESDEGKELVPDEEMADIEVDEIIELNESIEEPCLQEIVNKDSTYEKTGCIEVNMEEEGIDVEPITTSCNEEKSGTDKEKISMDNISEIDMEKAVSPMDVDSLSYEENLERDNEASTKLDSSQEADESENTVKRKIDEKESREDSDGDEEDVTVNITESCLPHDGCHKSNNERINEINEIESTAKTSQKLIRSKQDSAAVKNIQTSEEEIGEGLLNEGVEAVVSRISENEDATTPLLENVTETNETLSPMKTDPSQKSLSTVSSFIQESGRNEEKDSPSNILNDQDHNGLNQPVATSTPSIQKEHPEEEHSNASKSDPDFSDVSADEEGDEENLISKRKRKRQTSLKKRGEIDKKIGAEASSKSCDKKEKFIKKRSKSEDVNHPRFKVPLEQGWVRELVFRNKHLAIQSRIADVYYYTPSGRKLRSTIELKKHLTKGLTMDNFTFAKESIGINDNLREIVRDARVRYGPAQPSECSEVVVGSRSKRDTASKMRSNTQPSIKSDVKSDPRPPSPALVNSDNDDDTRTDKLLEENFELENEFDEEYAFSSDYQEDSGDGGPNERLVRKNKCTLKCSKALNLIPTIECSKCFLKYHPECEDIKTEDADEEDLSEIIEYVCNSCRLEMKDALDAFEPNLSQLPPVPKIRPLVKFSHPLVPDVKVTVNNVDEDNVGNNESSSVDVEDYCESDSDISDNTSSESYDSIVIEENVIEVEDHTENENEDDEDIVNNVAENTTADLNNGRTKDSSTDRHFERQVAQSELESDDAVRSSFTENRAVDLSNIITEDAGIDKQIDEQVTENEVEPDNVESTTIELNITKIVDAPGFQDKPGCSDKQTEEQVKENEVEPVENYVSGSTAVDINNSRMKDPSIDKQLENLVIQRRKGKKHKERELLDEGAQVETERENQEEYHPSFSGLPIEFSGEMYQSIEASNRIQQFLASSQYLEDYNMLRSQMANNYNNSSVGEVPVEVPTTGSNSAVTPFAQIILPGNPSIIAENIAEKSIPVALREPLITAPVDELEKDAVQDSSSCDPLATNSPVKSYPSCLSKDKVRTARINKSPHKNPDVRRASSSKDKPTVKKARNMKEPCNCKLSATTSIFKCNSLTEQDRAFIHNKFWMINSWDKKKKFVAKLIDKLNTTDYPSISSSDSSEKVFDTGNIIYYLMKGGTRIRVCRKMFLNTLGIGDWSLSNWLKSLR